MVLAADKAVDRLLLGWALRCGLRGAPIYGFLVFLCYYS